jgi:hypothetical protein
LDKTGGSAVAPVSYFEVVSKPSIGLKVKEDRNGQPQEYREYFEDWTFQFNTEIEPERGF